MAAWRRYWFEFPVLRRRLALWRVLFFGLLAADFWLILLEHVPRFGAGGFNVSQFPLLDPWLPVPTPAVVGPLYLLGGFLSTAIALGIAPRRCLFVLAPVYAGVYFWSQSDSYQHHYLISLLLILLTFVPAAAWSPPAPGEPERVDSWAMRLVYVQIGLMYAWTAVTKHTDVWLDGTTLEQILTCEPREHLRALSAATGMSLEATLAAASAAVMVGEYIAGVVYFARPLWIVGLGLIPLFHIGVEWLGLDIELFSYYMIGTNLILLMPERWLDGLWTRAAAALAPVARGLAPLTAPQAMDAGPARAMIGGLAVLLLLAGLTTPYDGAPLAGVLLALAAFFVLRPWTGVEPRLRGHTIGLLLAGLALALTARFSETAYNYYRQWGGFLRRQGDDAGAMEMYTRANAAAGERPARHLQLAKLVARRQSPAEALLLVDEDIRRQTLRLEGAAATPTDADAWFERGKTAKALADALAYAAELYPGVGRQAEVAEARKRREDALVTAREAFRKNMELSPACGQGRMELSRLSGGRNASESGGEQ